MADIVPVSVSSLSPIEYQGQRVITLSMMDQVHGRPDGTAGRNFRANKAEPGRLVEGNHYLCMNLDEFRRGFPGVAPERGGGMIVLLTERGYLVLVKSFTDSLAWTVQDQLVEGYFRGKALVHNAGLSVAEAMELFQKMAPAIIASTVTAVMESVAVDQRNFEKRFEERLAAGQIGTAVGLTTGEILDEFKIKGVPGLAVRMSNILCKRGCQLPSGARAHSGKSKAKLFLPDKSFQMMRDWLADDCRKYIQERKGQRSLNLVSRAV